MNIVYVALEEKMNARYSAFRDILDNHLFIAINYFATSCFCLIKKIGRFWYHSSCADSTLF